MEGGTGERLSPETVDNSEQQPGRWGSPPVRALAGRMESGNQTKACCSFVVQNLRKHPEKRAKTGYL